MRPYLDTMTRSELMAIMMAGFATVAGGVMAAYVKMGIDAGHLVTASVIAAHGIDRDREDHAARGRGAGDAGPRGGGSGNANGQRHRCRGGRGLGRAEAGPCRWPRLSSPFWP